MLNVGHQQSPFVIPSVSGKDAKIIFTANSSKASGILHWELIWPHAFQGLGATVLSKTDILEAQLVYIQEGKRAVKQQMNNGTT
jgi:hypothetical protein